MKIICSLILSFIFLVHVPKSNAELKIEINIDSTMLFRGDTLIEIPVYLSNFTDTIAGFNFWFQLDRPDIALFQMYLDSGVFKVSLDTTGSILPSGGYLDARSLSGFGAEANIAWNAKTPALENSLLPQVGGKLFTLILDPVSGFPTSTESYLLPSVNLWDIQDKLIGVDYLTDTTYFECEDWCGPVCCEWNEIGGLPADSIAIDTNFSVGQLDTTEVKITEGLITTTCCNFPGDMNSSNFHADIADLTFRVNYMFKGGSAPFCFSSADINNDCNVDILDLTDLVYYMFCHARKPCGDIYCGCID